MQLQKETFQFLVDLKSNNNRDWFQENKPRYQQAHEDVAAFTEDTMGQLSGIDHIELASGKKSLMRIYRDVRFSKDKTPYRTGFCGYFKRATEKLRGSYVFNIEPGNSFIGGGFWGPEAADLLKIRKGIQSRWDEFQAIVEHPDFKNTFGKIKGDALKTAPKGFPKDDPAIEYLRLKQFLVGRDVSDEFVLQPNFQSGIIEIYLKLRPFFDFMSEVLTRA